MAVIARQLFLLTVYCLLAGSHQVSTPESDSYVAAVVEYSPVSGATLENAEQIFMQNVARYITYMAEAAKANADIVVFPEAALASMGVPLKTDGTPGLAFNVPSPGANPCVDADSVVAEGLKTLSCGARDNNLYVVVNLPEKEGCNSGDCPATGAFFHNTNVVFDRSGEIVARYRKYNLYGEAGFVPTDQPEHAIFETDFGVRFGVFICFDMMFEEPEVVVARNEGVCDFVFSTAWFSEAPFLIAVQEQAAWSYAVDANLLAAGYNKPMIGSAGSGIYLGNAGALNVTMPTKDTTTMLVGTVPKKQRCAAAKSHSPAKASSSADERQGSPQSSGQRKEVEAEKREPKPLTTGKLLGLAGGSFYSGLYLKRDNLEVYDTVSLQADAGFQNVQLCRDSFCCDFEVEFEVTSTSRYFYRLAAFDGVRSFDGTAEGGLQVCALIPCWSTELSSCGQLKLTDAEAEATVFRRISMSASFRTNHTLIAPNTLGLGLLPVPVDRFSFSTQQVSGGNVALVNMTTTKVVRDTGLSVYTFAIYSRDFILTDQPFTGGSAKIQIHAALYCLILKYILWN